MNGRFEKQNSVVSGIINGSIVIDSVAEFENLLKIFPNNPALYRFFADFLAKEKPFDAADAYRTTSNLFIEAGRTLQAIVSKILEWRIVKPSHQEARAFYTAIREGETEDTVLQGFFTDMTYPEMIAFMVKLEIQRFPANSTVKKFGSDENDLYFVVSGALEETIYHRLRKGEKVQEKSRRNLLESDFFGEIYPFEEQRVSPLDVETVTWVELVKVSKSRLMTICGKYPNVERLIKDLYKARSKSGEEGFSETLRKTARHQLPTLVNIKIFQDEAGPPPLDLTGFTENISLGGALVVLGAKYETGPSANMIGRNVKIQMSFPTTSVQLTVLGTIVWSKEASLEGKTTVLVGIHFKEMSNIDRGVLKDYCYGSKGEQDLIWSLWESLVAK